MLSVLEFVFSSFWVWLGTFLLLGVLCRAAIACLAVILARNVRIR